MFNHIGERIRSLRQQQKLTQVQLSQNLCTAAYLSKVENGIEKPSAEFIAQMAERLSVPVVALTRDDEQEIEERLDAMIAHYCHTRQVEHHFVPLIEHEVKWQTSLYRLPIMYAMLIDYYDDERRFDDVKQLVAQALKVLGTNIKEGYEQSSFIYLTLICMHYAGHYQFHKMDPILTNLLTVYDESLPPHFRLQFYTNFAHTRDQAFKDYYQARMFILKVIALRKQLGKSLSDSYAELIVLDLKYKHFDSAQQLLLEAEREGHFQQDDYFVDYCYARFYDESEDFTRAIPHYERAIDRSAERLGHKSTILIYRLITILTKQEKYDEVRKWIDYGLEAMKSAPINVGHAGIYHHRATICLLVGDEYSYEKNMIATIQFCHQHDLMEEFKELTKELSDYYFERRQYKQAAKFSLWHIDPTVMPQ